MRCRLEKAYRISLRRRQKENALPAKSDSRFGRLLPKYYFCIVTYNNCFSKILSSNSSESYAIVGISIMNPT
jgi:hypothetical protein